MLNPPPGTTPVPFVSTLNIFITVVIVSFLKANFERIPVRNNVLFLPFRVQSITTKFHTQLNSVMNSFIKHLFTPNSLVAQL